MVSTPFFLSTPVQTDVQKRVIHHRSEVYSLSPVSLTTVDGQRPFLKFGVASCIVISRQGPIQRAHSVEHFAVAIVRQCTCVHALPVLITLSDKGRLWARRTASTCIQMGLVLLIKIRHCN